MTLRDIGTTALDTDLSEYGIFLFWAVMVIAIGVALVRSYANLQREREYDRKMNALYRHR